MRGVNTHAQGINGAVAAELRGELSAQGKTQADLAAASGVPIVSVQRYLKPSRAIDIEVLDKLARALGLSPTDVLIAATQRLNRA